MDPSIVAALIGVGSALAGVIVGAILTHLLSLREDAIKRQRDEIYEDAEKLRKELLEGVTRYALRRVYQDE